MAFLTGLSALTGALSNSPANRTTTSTGTSTQNQSGTSNYNRTLTPYQSALQSPLFGYISNLMTNPQAAVAPFQQAGRDQVSSNYNGLADSLRQQFLSTGGGKSGKYGMALAQGNLQRLGQLSNVDNSFAQTAAQLPLTASNLATNLLGMNFGGTSSTSSTGSGANNQTVIGPGSPLAGAFQGATSALGSQQNLANAIIAAIMASGGGF